MIFFSLALLYKPLSITMRKEPFNGILFENHSFFTDLYQKLKHFFIRFCLNSLVEFAMGLKINFHGHGSKNNFATVYGTIATLKDNTTI